MSADNIWHWWHEALAGRLGPIHDSDPHQGYFRTRFKDKPWEPVAIWFENDKWNAMRGDKLVDAADIWTWCCRNPISYEAYTKAIEGGGWDDEPEAVRGMGDNLPTDPHEALKLEFAGEKELAESFLKNPIKTEDDANKAAIWSKRVAGIFNSADILFRAKKDPIVKSGKDVDEEFRWREDAKKLSASLKAHIDPYLKEKQRAELERQRKAREEADRIQREADAARVVAEKAAAKNDNASDAAAIAERNNAIAEADRLADQAAQAERDAQARNASAGRTGAKVSLRTFVFAEVTDFDALLMALKDRAEIKEVVETLANRAARSGVELAGMAIRSEQRAA